VWWERREREKATMVVVVRPRCGRVRGERQGKIEATNELEPSGTLTLKEERGRRQAHLLASVFASVGCIALDQNLMIEIFFG
jgi:hypothetical protein